MKYLEDIPKHHFGMIAAEIMKWCSPYWNNFNHGIKF